MADDRQFDELDILRGSPVPKSTPGARARALEAAMVAYEASERSSTATQGAGAGRRLTTRAVELWRDIMHTRLVSRPAIAGLMALPIVGYVSWQFVDEMRFATGPAERLSETGGQAPAALQPGASTAGEAETRRGWSHDAEPSPLPESLAAAPAPALASRPAMTRDLRVDRDGPKLFLPTARDGVALPPEAEDRERFLSFAGNPVRSALEDPVSTFSIDVDTASYAYVRRSLNGGFMPPVDSVRVEEMINYFPYDWTGPDGAETPFNTTVTITPTPWNEHTRLMHVGIKGYDIVPEERPRANIVLLVDTSGSMNPPDRLPLLRNAFRLLVDRLQPDDRISIVTYAGNAGTVLEPTAASERGRIVDALDRMEAGGRTAGEAGIREAYRLAQESFIEGGVNRIILATDGDFNVGTTSDEELQRLVEEKRRSGVHLSVLGVGRGNLNDQLMQTLAQNGNGTAAYIDTLAEAEKVLSQEVSSTLFTIASDVKIQVEFNPELIAEYRLIGYETRALNREDFNNDRVDAGDIGSGHSVTAIYEITPRGSPAQMIDDLRYGAQRPQAGSAATGEYAFVKVRHKAPGEDTSRLTTTAVTEVNAVATLDAAPIDVRFSIAVAAFGQKLRGTDAVAGMGYERIMEIATAARGADPFGYRAEFLSLVRLASALDGRR